MDLFKRKKKQPAESAIIASLDAQLGDDDKDAYNNTLNYLVGLTDDEYDKMLKCAKVYRDADKKVTAIMETKAPNGGDIITVRVVPKADDSLDFIDTDTKNGKKADDK